MPYACGARSVPRALSQESLILMARSHKYTMVIDASQCMNCKACVVSCQLENRVPVRHGRNWIRETPEGGDTVFQPANCMQCEEPSCVAACPAPGATYIGKDGIVVVNPDRCINCGNCVAACPYGARYRHPERLVADKCDFCRHRIAMGLEPACVVTCPTRVRKFGDLNDPASEVSKLVAKGGLVTVANTVVNTKPNIYFLAGTRPLTWPKEPTLPGGQRMPREFWREKRYG